MQTYDNDSKNPIVQAALDQPAELNLESVAAGDNLPVTQPQQGVTNQVMPLDGMPAEIDTNSPTDVTQQKKAEQKLKKKKKLQAAEKAKKVDNQDADDRDDQDDTSKLAQDDQGQHGKATDGENTGRENTNGEKLTSRKTAAKVIINVAKTLLGVDGVKNINANVTDAAGNVGTSQTLAVTVDTVAPSPVLAIKSGQDDSLLATETNVDIEVSYSGLSAGDKVQLRENGFNVGGEFTVTAADVMAGKTTIRLDKSLLGADGDKSVSAQVTDKAGNQGVSAVTHFQVYSIATTTTISSIKDDVGTNGSQGSAAAPVTINNGSGTDDSVPIMSGTVSAALKTGEVVAIYDTINGVVTRLGTATVSGTTWSYTPDTALTNATHHFTARVENPTSATQAPGTADYAITVYGVMTQTVSDDVGTTQGIMANNAITDDAKPTFSGTLGTALASGEEVAIYQTLNSVTTKLGVATVTGTSWSYTPASPLADGSYGLKAIVQAVGATTTTAARTATETTNILVDTAVPNQTVTVTSVDQGLKARYIMVRYWMQDAGLSGVKPGYGVRTVQHRRERTAMSWMDCTLAVLLTRSGRAAGVGYVEIKQNPDGGLDMAAIGVLCL